MCRRTLLLAAMMLSAPALADDKKAATAAELKAKIAALKTELAILEAELAKVEPAKELKFEKDGRGVLPLPKNTYYYVIRVIAKDEINVVLCFRGFGGRDSRHGLPFVLRGVSTAGVVAEQEIELKGEFRVTGDTIIGGSSNWIVEPVKK